MEMFNKTELDKRIGPLQKSKSLYDLEAVEGYVIRKCGEYGLEHSYDVMAEEMPYFKTIAYTEYAGCFYLQPLNLKLRNEQMIDAYFDKTEIVDYSSWLINRIVDKKANKYEDRAETYDKYPPKDYLVVLPGSNKVRENVCLNRLKYIKRLHGDNVYFKPHPITTHQIIGELKDFFGEENILPRHIDMYHYLQKAKGVYTTHISESCIYGIVTGKKTEPIDVWNDIQRGSFYCINNHLLTHQKDAKEYINKTFSSYKSGIINPEVDKNWKEKVDKYMDYIVNKRETYKNWFLADK
tara:strand:- start:465 stop:1349 length:885 start_codon:yes stop_codon:yes gene_type:complete